VSIEENKVIVQQVEQAWNTGDLDVLDNLFAPNFIAHNAIPGMPPGLEGAKMAHMGSVQALPDRRTTIEDMFAEREYVVARVRMTGTNQGGFPWLSIPANGNKVDIQWTSIYRLADRKIVEHSAVMDMLGLLQQLGVVPAMA
jgi:predicted ester cyclase